MRAGLSKDYARRAALAWVLLFPLAACAQSGQERAAAAGELVRLKGFRVLRLFGGAVRERGFAHGWLLAKEIIGCVDDALKSLPKFTAREFEDDLKPWTAKRFFFDADATAELDGIFEGLRERLGEAELLCPALGRALTRPDLDAVNTIADLFGPKCSGFTAWGALTEGGQVIHGRNLDFPIGGKAVADQVILAVEALPARGELPARAAWVGVGWPGLVGAYSAMNAGGLVACMHDATNVQKGGSTEQYVPRGVLLRRIVESVDPSAAEPAEAAAQLVAQRPAACGNLFHLSWPKAAAEQWQETPAAVLEFDASAHGAGAQGVSVRRMDASGALVVTNHFCRRSAPVECERFKGLSEALQALTKDGHTLGLAEARKILIAAEIPLAAHTVVFWPAERALHVALTRGNILSTRAVGASFGWRELTERPEPKP